MPINNVFANYEFHILSRIFEQQSPDLTNGQFGKIIEP